MLKEGQVLWMRFRFNNVPGEISETVHPYIVVDIDKQLKKVELIQGDSLKDKYYLLAKEENVLLRADNETVFYEYGYAQLDNCFMVEYSEGLEKYKQTDATMSKMAFEELKRRYQVYQMSHNIFDNKTVFMRFDELEEINN